MEMNHFMSNIIEAEDIFTDKQLLEALKPDSLSTCDNKFKLALKLIGEKGAGEIIFVMLALHDRIRELEQTIEEIKNNT